MEQKKLNRSAIWIIIIGGTLSFILPLFLPFLPLSHLKGYGDIGDAVNGIGSPVTQLVGFVLLFLTLKAQVKANSLIQGQVEAENRKDTQQRELTQLQKLYSFMESNIKSFNYENRFDTKGSPILLYGRRAIRCFINDIEKRNIDLHNTEELLQEDGVREIMSVLNTATAMFHKIESANIEDEDRLFYKNIMKHELVFSIFPYTDLDESANLILPVCEECGKRHGNYPPLILDKLIALKRYF